MVTGGFYGYKSQKLLDEYIRRSYNNAQIEISNKIITVRSETNEIIKHFVPIREVLAEIAKYAYKNGPISTVNLIVKNTANNRHEKQIKHIIRMESHQWVCETEYKSGSIDRSKSRYLDF